MHLIENMKTTSGGDSSSFHSPIGHFTEVYNVGIDLGNYCILFYTIVYQTIQLAMYKVD